MQAGAFTAVPISLAPLRCGESGAVQHPRVRVDATRSTNPPTLLTGTPRPRLARLPRRPRPRAPPAPRPVRASAADDGRPAVSSLPSDFPPGALLGDRYEVDAVLGRGGQAVTYRCRDAQTGCMVAVKALSLRGLRDWKQLDLFQREAQTLETLDHPGIPRYLDSFEEDSAADRAFFLVQELAEGASLEAMVARGWRADEGEVSRIARNLLSILRYLGSRRPAVVHRDVKPANVVIEGGRTGGRVTLVDFGGVQAAAATGGDLPGSTVIGTYGFMAPEQFRGAAVPASDLYGLGGTLLYVLSGRPPSAFPVDRMRLDLSTVPMGPTLEAVVEGLLEPVLEDRLTAEAAAAMLEGRTRPAPARRRGGGAMGGSAFRGTQQREVTPAAPAFMEPRAAPGQLRKPPGSRVVVTKRGPRLEIDIPPAKFDGSTAATGAFAVAWNAFVAFWTVSALAGGGVLFALFSLPFWFAGASLVKQAFGRQFIRERLEIGLGRWELHQALAGLRGRGADAAVDWAAARGKNVGGSTADLGGASMQVVAYVNGVPQGQLVLRQGVESIVLGEGLDPLEQEWLADVINAHLAEVEGRRGDIQGFADEWEESEQLSEGIAKGEFDDFDRRLGVDGAVAAAEAAGRRAAAEGRAAGAAAAADARRAADEAARRAKRAAAAPSRVDSGGVINLDSNEFDVMDSE